MPVIFPRQGLVALPPIKVRHIDGTQGAGLVARKWEDWQADACFIDKGGFGSSWIDKLRRLGREPIGIAFSGRASDPRYDNKRTEMYFAAVDWIRKGGALPPEGSRDWATRRAMPTPSRSPSRSRWPRGTDTGIGRWRRWGCARARACGRGGCWWSMMC